MLSLLSAGSLLADVKVGPGELNADARAALIQVDDGNDQMNALGIGFNALYKQEIDETFSVGAGIGVATPVLESKDGTAANYLYLEHGSTPAAGKTGKSGSFMSINQLHVNYEKEGNKATVGRFVVDTPLAASDDNYRLNKNAFEGIVATFDQKVENTTFVAGYIQSNPR